MRDFLRHKPDLRQPEVGEAHMPIEVDQYVLRLEVAVQDSAAVEFFESAQYLTEVVLDLVFPEALVLEVVEEFTAGTEFHEEGEVVFGGETGMQLDYESIILFTHSDTLNYSRFQREFFFPLRPAPIFYSH